MFDFAAEVESFGGELESTLVSVARSGTYILGGNVAALEERLAAHTATGHAVGVGSGTDALVLALRALGLPVGSRVVVPAFSFVATATAVLLAGYEPVFCDIDDTLNLDVSKLEATLARSGARAIVPVHLFGLAANMGRIMDVAEAMRAWVVEDVAQALGAKWRGRPVGSFGVAGCLSFYPTKTLGAMGDGGAICTADAGLAARVRSLRNHGAGADRYFHDVLGYNSRLDELQAAVLRVKLERLDQWLDRRRAILAAYRSELDGEYVTWPPLESLPDHAASVVTGEFRDRDGLRRSLSEQGVDTMVYYPHILPEQPAIRRGAVVADRFERASLAAGRVLSLPIHPFLADEDVAHVCSAIRAYYR